MGLDEAKLRAVPDGGVLCTLPSGIQVIRRRKHEPIDLDGLSKDEIERRTSKANGSKFLPGTSLRRIIEVTAEVLAENDAQVGSNDGYTKVYDEPIGISRGRLVKAVRVSRSARGKFAHAYPEDERRR